MTRIANENGQMQLELLGIGSAKNRALRANLDEALSQLDMKVAIQEVSSIEELLQYDISGIPALVVNGRVVFQRVVPSVEDIKIVLSVLLQKEHQPRPVRRILVPIDFSETAENAFRYGMELAHFLSATLHLLHVDTPSSDLGHKLQLDQSVDNQSYKERMIAALRDRYLHAKQANPELGSLDVRTEVVSGQVVQEIFRVAELEDTDLLVMGTTGEGGLLGNRFGSISTQVARQAKCSVLLIPDGVGFEPFDRVVYASNYHPLEQRILPKVVDFILPFGSTVYFAHIREQKQAEYQVLPQAETKIFHQNGVTFQLTTIESADVVEGLNCFAKEKDAKLMIMMTTQRSFFEDIFHRSATRRMIFNTRIPLMIMHQ